MGAGTGPGRRGTRYTPAAPESAPRRFTRSWTSAAASSTGGRAPRGGPDLPGTPQHDQHPPNQPAAEHHSHHSHWHVQQHPHPRGTQGSAREPKAVEPHPMPGETWGPCADPHSGPESDALQPRTSRSGTDFSSPETGGPVASSTPAHRGEGHVPQQKPRHQPPPLQPGPPQGERRPKEPAAGLHPADQLTWRPGGQTRGRVGVQVLIILELLSILESVVSVVTVKRMHNGSVKGHHWVVAQSGVPEDQSPTNRDRICPLAIRPTPLRLRYLRDVRTRRLRHRTRSSGHSPGSP